MKLKRLRRAWRAHRNLLDSIGRYPQIGMIPVRIRISYAALLEAAGLDLAECRDTATLADFLVASGGVS